MSRPRFLFFFLAIAFLFVAAIYIQQQQPMLACQSRRTQLEATVKMPASCTADVDCTLLTNGCGSFTTCGEAVRADALPALRQAMEAYESQCAALGVMTCVSCIPLQARCREKVCVAEHAQTL